MKIYYSIRNGGDGSASITWMESQELASWDQDHMYEGWGEDCSGSIEIEGRFLEKVITKEAYLLDMDEERETSKFIEQFFPQGLPDFTVTMGRNRYYNILANGFVVATRFAYPEIQCTEEGVKRIQEELDNL